MGGITANRQRCQVTISCEKKIKLITPYINRDLADHSPTTPNSHISPTSIDSVNMPGWLHKDSQEIKDYEAVRSICQRVAQS